MTLAPRTKLGPYEILAPLGAGGMGEVYRAKDPRLGREVAIKVLPEDFLEGEERRQRFEREARLLAALNHPGIAAVYSFEEIPSSSLSSSRHLLVMELVEGESLDVRIADGPLPLEESLSFAKQIAEALEAAHEKGIVHRDLKPANVMVTKGGRVKLLDFGLAKVAAVGESAKADTTLPTDMKTREGVVMGTVPYMSPEQVSGRPLDQRTDIFSLGVILYEMATGQRPFQGDSSAELISSILRDTPRPPGELREGLPVNLERIVQGCLEKNTADRIQSARDLLDRLRGVTAQAPATATAAAPPSRPVAADSGAARADEGFWVAVLPFKAGGAGADLKALSEGMTEEIVTGLSRFPYLRVISRASTSRYIDVAVDVRTAGKEIGARYVMEGSLRQAGAQLRVAVQLVDASTGAHLWAETYTRPFEPDQVFAIQDDLVPRIVSTCADHFGVLARSISDVVRGNDPGLLSPYEALMRGFGYHHRLTPAEHGEARAVLERAVERAPNNADCWAMLSWIYSHEHAHGFNPRPGSLERALAAARRAVDLAPSNHLAQQALAVVLFFRKEKTGCLAAAERAIALNPLDASNEAIFLITFTGDWERGCALIRRAMDLNPHHPRWYGLVLGMNEYRLANYRAAVDEFIKANAPDVFWTNWLLAAAYGQLGELAAARNALRDLLAQKEDFAQSAAELMGKWFEPQLAGQLMEGLRKAGLVVVPEKGAGAPALEPSNLSSPVPGAARAEEGFWVAVLPFKYSGSNADLAALAEGLSEEIVTGLSRFSYLRVVARGSTLQGASQAADLRTVGKELGARYVMEGSLRQAGPRLRLAVQLVDATSGAHLWAENYERTFSPDAVFELQDELVPRIVSTIADMHGILPRSLSEAVRSRDPGELSAYEAVLRSFGYFERITGEELAAARSGLESAVRKAPASGDAWAMLALLCVQDYAQGFNLQADALERGLAAARRAVELSPSNHLSHYGLAQALFFLKELPSFRNEAERAVALNPMDGNTLAFLGELLSYSGDCERGAALAARAKQLNPNHPGFYWFADFYNAYRQRNYRGALAAALNLNLPGHMGAHMVLAAAYGQLGEREAADKAVRDLLKVRPDFASIARGVLRQWWTPEYVEQLIDGWRKAGLDVPAGGPWTQNSGTCSSFS
jgi:TolB-like protein/tetratricopeptide (TPR) repeat protein